ncbi:androgen-induced gene 1 protein-like [Euwallacea fornicatus]|uniref:androgen-induced gene 1 protein-like n=1 Tax=Euwallacea fornicatus TaxID=995702 RepID=UPI00338EA1D8
MGIPAIAHLLIAAHFWFGCYYDWNFVKIPAEIADLGDNLLNTHKLKFLTYWDALLQSIFFTICFLNDIFGTNDENPKTKPIIRKMKDVMLPVLAFPLSMFVGLTFWGLYAVNRELVFPKIIDQFFPTWLNHLMHTNIMIFTLMETLLSYRKYPSRKVGLSIFVLFMLSYLVWIVYLHSYTNKWVYPVLNILSFPFRIVFFLSNFVFAVIVYVLGEKINNFRWGKRAVIISGKTRKQKKN